MDRIWSDSLVHDEDALTLLIKKLGIDHVFLGSDFPFPLGEHHPGKLVEECKTLTQQEKEKVLGLNALKFLGIEESRFKDNLTSLGVDENRFIAKSGLPGVSLADKLDKLLINDATEKTKQK